MEQNNIKVNIFKLTFENIINNDDIILIEFKGKSTNYKDSYLYGELNINKLNNEDNEYWSWVMTLYINSVYIKINNTIEKSKSENLNVIDLWKLILNNKKLCHALNTVSEENINKNYEYVTHIRSLINKTQEINLYIHLENFKWKQNEIIEEINNNPPEEIKEDIVEKYIPEELIGKQFYSQYIDLVNSESNIGTLKFTNDKISRIVYSDNTLSTINDTEEFNLDNIKYDKNSRKIIIEINYDTIQYFNPTFSQGRYTKKIIYLNLNESFTEFNETGRFVNIYIPEITAFKPLLEENGWIVNLSAVPPYVVAPTVREYSLEIPGMDIDYNSYFPPQIVNKNYYTWVYDIANEKFYLSAFEFKEDKLIETWYIDETQVDYVRRYEYNREIFFFDAPKNILQLDKI